MNCGQCEPFAAAVKAHYAYLFDTYGLRQVHCAEAKAGEYCLVVLESPRARIKFELEKGTPTTYLGTLDSPLKFGDEVDGVTVWYVDNTLLNFLEQRSPDRTAHGAPPPDDAALTTGDLLKADAARLRPFIEELLAAFAPDRPAAWWQAYDAYVEERLQRIRQALAGR